MLAILIEGAILILAIAASWGSLNQKVINIDKRLNDLATSMDNLKDSQSELRGRVRFLEGRGLK